MLRVAEDRKMAHSCFLTVSFWGLAAMDSEFMAAKTLKNRKTQNEGGKL